MCVCVCVCEMSFALSVFFPASCSTSLLSFLSDELQLFFSFLQGGGEVGLTGVAESLSISGITCVEKGIALPRSISSTIGVTFFDLSSCSQ